MPPPFPLPPYYVVQHWHERYANDPAAKWLRGVIGELFLEKGLSSGPERGLAATPHNMT
jgi:hypothetical protein